MMDDRYQMMDIYRLWKISLHISRYHWIFLYIVSLVKPSSTSMDGQSMELRMNSDYPTNISSLLFYHSYDINTCWITTLRKKILISEKMFNSF